MEIDRAVHYLFENLNNIRWRDISEGGLFEYYYAENRLYILREKRIGQIYFVEANSPKDALMTIAGAVSWHLQNEEDKRCAVCVETGTKWCSDCTENGGRYNYFKVR